MLHDLLYLGLFFQFLKDNQKLHKNFDKSFLACASSVINPLEREELFAGKKIAVDKYFGVIISETTAEEIAVNVITIRMGLRHFKIKTSKLADEKSLF